MFFKVALIVFTGMFLSFPNAHAKENPDEKHIQVALRMIGHKILLSSGDSTSRVLPIEKEGDLYRVRFGSDFQFNPDELVSIIDSIVAKTEIADHYLVEVEGCKTQQIVYSYEIGNSNKSDIVPCKSRDLPKDCYNLLFTILHTNTPLSYLYTAEEEISDIPAGVTKDENSSATTSLVIVLLLMIVIFAYFLKKKNNSKINPDLISMGKFRFDKRNMKLSYKNDVIELTGKESDLLLLLYASANNTLERDVILNAVWGNEGDYIGRTLDVFISKLRKKLEADPDLKIVNIRGIGYKMIVNE